MARLRKIDHAQDRVSDSKIISLLGVSQVTLCRMRRDMGYRKKRAPRAASKRVEVRVGHKGKWSRFPHPRGFKGGKHTADSLAAMSANSLKMWADPSHKLNSEEMKQRRSDRAHEYMRKGIFKGGYSRAKSGKRDDLGGLYVRSAWEANYARYLNFLKSKGEIHAWEYEADTFVFEAIKRGTRAYTPDFKVWSVAGSDPYYVEVKGWMDPISATKLKRMAKYFPQVKIEIVDHKQMKAIAQWSTLIPGWERIK